ncbi:MAG: cadherin-like domain-containing protein, partial [Coriobacteriia bacterium]|nr:cadherin-like domain-containing protein [Coriobacteriia bacterium]
MVRRSIWHRTRSALSATAVASPRRRKALLFGAMLAIAITALGVTIALAAPSYTINYYADPIGGYISGESPQTLSGEDVGSPVEAIPYADYVFVQWDDGTTANPRQDSGLTGDMDVTAQFEWVDPGGGDPGGGDPPIQYALTYFAGDGGTISGEALQFVDEGSSGSTVEAVPDPGFVFARWSDEFENNPRTDVDVWSDITATAIFEADPTYIQNLRSESHPSESFWSRNTTPTFSWDMTSAAPGYSWVLNQDGGSGTLDSTIDSLSVSFPTRSEVASWTDYGYLTQMESGDLNNDGRPDFVGVIQEGQRRVGILFSSGSDSFEPMQAIQLSGTTGSNPLGGVAIGDVNEDGWNDIAVSDMNSVPPRVVVLTSDQDGTFTEGAGVSVPLFDQLGQVELVDMDNDGTLDIVTQDHERVHVFTGNGDATFNAPSSTDALGFNIMRFDTGDMNEDGRKDIVTADYSGNCVRISRWNADGTWSTGGAVPSGTGTSDVAVLDIDRDGHLDVVSAWAGDGSWSSMGGAQRYLGDGTGSLGMWSQFTTSSNYLTRISVSDFNRDGYSDLAILDWNVMTKGVHVFLNNASGSFGPIHSGTGAISAAGFAIADTNGDGIDEIVSSIIGEPDAGLGTNRGYIEIARRGPLALTGPVGDGVHYFHVRQIDSLGSAGAEVDRAVRIDTTPPTMELTGVTDGGIYASTEGAVANLTTSDANSGVAMLEWMRTTDVQWSGGESSSVSIPMPTDDGAYQYDYRMTDNAGNVGTGHFHVRIVGAVTNFASPTNPDEDRWYRSNDVRFTWDLSGGANAVSYDLNDSPDGGELNASPDPLPLGYTLTSMSAGAEFQHGEVQHGDFNNDGIGDIVYDSGSVKTMHGSGDGTFYLAYSDYNGNSGSLCVGDFNEDGIDDFLYGGFDTYWTLYQNNGNGASYTKRQIFGARVMHDAQAADFNGDGHLDFVAAAGNNAKYEIFFGNGNGTFDEAVEYQAPAADYRALTGDFEGDGDQDVFLASPDNRNVSLFLNDGTGVFPTYASADDVPVQGTVDVVECWAVGDLNGDGYLDVACNRNNGSVLRVLEGSASGLGSAATVGDGNGSVSTLVLEDFNNDAALDIGITQGGYFKVLANDGLGNFPDAWAGLRQWSLTDKIVAAFDCNNDGRTDVVASPWYYGGFASLLSDGARVGFTGVADGEHYFHVRGVRGATAGPVTTHRVRVDANDPTVTISGAVDGEGFLPESAPTLAVSALDSGSGLRDFKWRAVGEPWADEADAAVDITVPSEPGFYRYDFQARDIAGNVRSFRFSVTIFGEISGANVDGLAPDQWTWNTNLVGYWDNLLGAHAYSHEVSSDPATDTLDTTADPTDRYLIEAGTIAATGNPAKFLLVDVSNDGVDDIVTADSAENRIGVQIGNGDASFGAEQLYSAADTGFDAMSLLTSGDFNDDGWTDVASAGTEESPDLLVFLNDGAGGLASGVHYLAGSSYSVDIKCADFTTDGTPDLLLVSLDGGYTILSGAGDGTFGPAEYHAIAATGGVCGATFGDYNGDGLPDFAIGCGDYRVRIYLNAGGTFELSNEIVLYDYLTRGMVSGDIDGDDKDDIFVWSTTGFYYLPPYVIASGSGFSSLHPINMASDPGLTDAKIADVNGDGANEIVYVNSVYGSVRVVAGNPSSGFEFADTLWTPQASQIAVSDLDGNATVELMISNASTSELYWYKMDNPLHYFGSAPDGTNYFKVRAVGSNDSGGPVTVVPFHVDTAYPTVSLEGMADGGTYIAAEGALGRIVATDPNAPDCSGIASVSYELVGGPDGEITVEGDTATVLLPTTPGSYTYNWGATDNAGLTTGGMTTFLLVDSATGLKSLTHPDPNTWYNSNRPGFAWDQIPGMDFSFEITTAAGSTPDLIGDAFTRGILSQPSLLPGHQYAADTEFADINNDGHLDLLWLNSGTDCMYLRLNNGSGGFDAEQEFDIGTSVTGLAVADVDKDGNLDVLVSLSNQDAIGIFEGDGLGGFTRRDDADTGYGPRQIGAGDFDDDGNLDLVVGTDGEYYVGVMYGDGAFGFTAYNREDAYDVIALDNGSMGGVTVGDFDNDGATDFAASIWEGIEIRRNQGDSSFAQSVMYDYENYAYNLVSSDLNDDGTTDIVATDSNSNKLTVYFNSELEPGMFNGDDIRQFAAHSDGDVDVALGDVNGDGQPDIVTSNNNNAVVSVYANNGGDFSDRTDFDSAGFSGNGVAVGDFSGDGYADVAGDYEHYNDNTGDWEFGILTMRGGKALSTMLARPVTTMDFELGSSARYMTTGDFNSDGFEDVAFTNTYDDRISVRINDGAGHFDTYQPDIASMPYPSGIVAADFNKDGSVDLAVGSNTEGIVGLYVGDGEGGFVLDDTVTGLPSVMEMKTGDFNGDTWPDLVMAGDAGWEFATLVNDGAGWFGAPNSIPLTYLGSGRVTVADFDDDGRDDVAATYDGFDSMYNSWGTGVCVAMSTAEPGTYDTSEYYVPRSADIASADLNGDGQIDIVTDTDDGTEAGLLWNNGEGFDEDVYTQPFDDAWGLAVDDINGDGRNDLVHTSSYSSFILTQRNTGSTPVFDEGERIANTTNNNYDIATADFNHDGYVDVANVGAGWDDATSRNVSRLNVYYGQAPASLAEFGPLDDGIYNFNIRPVLGGVGGTTTSMQVKIDSGGPTVEMSGVTDGGAYSTAQQAVITASDSGAGVDRIEWRVGTGAWTQVEGDTATIDILTALSGSFTYQYRAYDLAGNASDTGSFTVTIIGPITGLVSSSHPDPGAWYNNQWPQFQWTAITGAQYSYSIDQNPAGEPDLAGDDIEGPTLFGAAHTYEVGDTPRRVTYGDFNEDGALDLVVVNRGSSSVSVLLNDGDGSFETTPAAEYFVGDSPTEAVADDLDGDGHLDLAVTNKYDDTVGGDPGSISVLPGIGDGTFGSETRFDCVAHPYGITSGDFDRNGSIDLAIAPNDEPTFTVLLNDGNGDFSNRSDKTPPSDASVYCAIGTGDFDADGQTDIAFSTRGNGLCVALGDGNGGFDQANMSFVGVPNGYAEDLRVGDMNADGHPDIVMTDYDGQIAVCVNNGTGEFTEGGTSWYSMRYSSEALTLGDVNGDGYPDAITAANDEEDADVQVFLGNGDGTLADPQTVYGNSGGRGVVAADLDGDGVDDLAASTSNNELAILLSSEHAAEAWVGQLTDGTWYFHVRQVSMEQGGPVSTVPVRIDGTSPTIELGGVVDGGVYASGSAPQVSLVATDPNAPECSGVVRIGYTPIDGDEVMVDGSSATFDLPTAPGVYTYRYYAWDAVFNSSGWDRMFTVTIVGDITGLTSSTHPDQGQSYETTIARLNWNLASGGSYSYSVDQDQNGTPDLTTDTINVPMPLVDSASYSAADLYSWVSAVGSGDFNEDGHEDVATGYNGSTGGIGIKLNQGDGTFSASSPEHLYTTNTVPRELHVVDLNEDGHLDLVFYNYGLTYAGIMFGNGDGSFQAMQTLAVGNTYGLALGDFNNDTHLDLAFSDSYALSVGVYLGNGDGTFGTLERPTLPAGRVSADKLGCADLDKDGRDELLVGALDDTVWNNHLLVLDGAADGMFTGATPVDYTLTNGGDFIASDFNDDGNLDVAAGSGSKVDVFLGDGTNGLLLSQTVSTGNSEFVLGDFNGDHTTDIVTSGGMASTIVVNYGTGDGTFAPGATAAGYASWTDIAASDFNGDGLSDVVVPGSGDTMMCLFGSDKTYNAEIGPLEAATWYFHIRQVGGASGSELGGTTATYRINIGAGVVTRSLAFLAGNGGSLDGTVTQSVIDGSDATAVTANPAVGHHFVNWTGTGSFETTTANPLVVGPVTEDGTITANFEINTQTLTYLAGEHGLIDDGKGTTTAWSPTLDYGTDGPEVGAVADPGYRFVKWSDESTANPRIDTNVTADATYTATFEIDLASNPDTFTAQANEVTTVTAPGVLANDSAVTSVEIVADAGHGHVTLAADGGFTYTPDTNYVGTDTFTYRATDGSEWTSPATVTLLVAPRTLETIEGTITAGGIGLNHIVVTAFDSTTDLWEASVFTDANGHYAMRVLNGYHHIRFTRAADGVLAEGLEQYYQHVKKIVDAQVVRNHVGERLVLSDDLTPLVD